MGNHTSRDLTGQKFAHLLALEPVDRRERGAIVWRFQCDCGAVVERQGRAVSSGGLQSCGCKRNKSHGESRTRLYGIWKAMRQRCRDPQFANYHNYGGRGITVCEAWDNAFEPFRDWALANGYEGHLSLDRRENEASYEPGNCRWVTWSEQMKNRRPFPRA
jgi:hypothetical protein